jgi:hypothetical protein
LACHLQIDGDPDPVPDPGYQFDADPHADPDFYLMRIRIHNTATNKDVYHKSQSQFVTDRKQKVVKTSSFLAASLRSSSPR